MKRDPALYREVPCTCNCGKTITRALWQIRRNRRMFYNMEHWRAYRAAGLAKRPKRLAKA